MDVRIEDAAGGCCGQLAPVLVEADCRRRPVRLEADAYKCFRGRLVVRVDADASGGLAEERVEADGCC